VLVYALRVRALVIVLPCYGALEIVGVIIIINSLHFVSLDYTVCVLHHHHFALVCER